MPSAFHAVLFDLGDTLIHFGDVDRDALFKQGARRTYQLWSQRQERMPDFQRYYLHQWFALRWGYFKLLLLGRERDAMSSIRRACGKLWLTAPDDFYDELAWQWYHPLAQIATVEPETRNVLETLRRRGYALAIVSNTFVPGFVLDRHLAELGLLEFFPHRVYSCDVSYRKPHSRIFELALQRLGVRASESIFIGDQPEADVAGARTAGMMPIWKRTTLVAHPPDASVLAIDRLAELPDKLEQIEAFTAQPQSLTA